MRISIVTPSYNQGEFLGACMRSVLDQAYPDLEYAIIDGGSIDDSVESIKRNANQICYWRSAPDEGQYAAVTEGFSKTSGDIMGWLNSDDLLCPWALSLIAEIFSQLPEVEWLTSLRPMRIDRSGKVVRCLAINGYSARGFFEGENLPEPGANHSGWIQQESTFWRRSLWEKAGGQVGKGYHLAGDFELWARFFKIAEIHGVEAPLGAFRFHSDQRSDRFNVEYQREARAAFTASGGQRRSKLREAMRQSALNLPQSSRPMAGRAGLLYESRICRHSRSTNTWRVEKVYA